MHASTNLAVTVIGLAAAAVVAGIVWFGTGTDPAPPGVGESPSRAPAHPSAISVHVSGAVSRPGVVTTDVDARVADVVRLAGGVTSDADLSSVNLAALVRDGDQVVVPVLGQPDGGSGATGIDLNRASAAELESLPGVGPVLAERIVAYRTDRGPFTEVEDLLDVPGIGEAKLDQMRPAIVAP